MRGNCEVRNTKIGPCATRALPRLGNMAFKVLVEMHGHLARANGKWGGRWPSVCRRRCEPLLAGRGGGFWGGAAPAPTRSAWGAPSSIRVPKKNARCPGLAWGAVPEGLAGVAKLRPLFPGGPGGEKPLLCCSSARPCFQMHKKKPIAVRVTRW
jgi:hypothetical protein